MLNTQDLNWIIGPAGQCIMYVAEETKLASLIHRGLIVLEGNDTSLRLMRAMFLAQGIPVDAIDHLMAEQPMLSLWAKEVINADFNPVNSHGLLGIWCAVETA